LRCVSACAIIQNTLEQLRILNRSFVGKRNRISVCESVAGKTGERERERDVHSCHEENKTSCWILISKNGMRIKVRALDRCGLLPKFACSNLSSSLALHLGPLQSHLLRQIGSAIQNQFLIELEKKLHMSSHLLNSRQPSTCSKDKLEIVVAPPTDIHPAAIDQICTGIFSKSKVR
jgi:hypothetical protein